MKVASLQGGFHHFAEYLLPAVLLLDFAPFMDGFDQIQQFLVLVALGQVAECAGLVGVHTNAVIAIAGKDNGLGIRADASQSLHDLDAVFAGLQLLVDQEYLIGFSILDGAGDQVGRLPGGVGRIHFVVRSILDHEFDRLGSKLVVIQY